MSTARSPRIVKLLLRFMVALAIGSVSLEPLRCDAAIPSSDSIAFSATLDIDPAKLNVGQLYRIEVDGKLWVGRFTGVESINGRPTAVFDNCTLANPALASPNVGAPAGVPAPPGETDAVGGGVPATRAPADYGQAITAGATAAGTTALYRIFVVPPALQNEIAEASKAAQAAEGNRAGAATKFTTTIKEITVSNEAWQRDVISRLKNPPVGPILLTSSQLTPASIPVPFRTTNASDRAALIDVYQHIARASIASPAQAEAKEIGTAALMEADEASIEGDRSGFATALRVGRAMADFLVGLDPFSGFVRDTLEFYTGVNQITGESLSDTDRRIRLLSAGMNIVSLGIATSCFKVVTRLASIVKRLRKIPHPPTQLLIEGAERFIKTPRGPFEWSQHALDRLGEGRMNRKQVEKVIEKGERYWDAYRNNVSYIVNQGKSSFQVAVDAGEERIATIVVRPFNPNTKLSNGLPRWTKMPAD